MSELTNVKFEPRVKLKADGALFGERHEIFALMLADGVPRNDAWRALGGGRSLSDAGRKYGKKIFDNPVFKQRVATLEAERSELEKDPIWGEAIWQINQLYRMAVATNDVKQMSDAVKLRVEAAKAIDRNKPEPEKPATDPDAPATTETARRPGRPSAESPQTKRDPAMIRAALMRVGQPADEDAEA